jgi:hypothetical protein
MLAALDLLKLCSCMISLGIVPANPLESIWRTLRFVSCPMLVDMLPVNWLMLMSSDSRAVKRNKVSGRVPLKVPLSISRDVKRRRLPNSPGSVPPSSVFESKSREIRFVSAASSLGSVPSRLFSSVEIE